ncbi:MAG: hypothetical protein RL564_1254 [Pseudomonadota bacterium]
MDIRLIVERWLHDRVPECRLDNEGTVILQREPESPVVIEIPEDSDVCHLSAPVAPLPEHVPREVALFTALEMNQFGRPLGSCWLAWNPELEVFMLCHNLHIPSTEQVSFNNTLDNFFLSLERAREHLLA